MYMRSLRFCCSVLRFFLIQRFWQSVLLSIAWNLVFFFCSTYWSHNRCHGLFHYFRSLFTKNIPRDSPQLLLYCGLKFWRRCFPGVFFLYSINNFPGWTASQRYYEIQFGFSSFLLVFTVLRFGPTKVASGKNFWFLEANTWVQRWELEKIDSGLPMSVHLFPGIQKL